MGIKNDKTLVKKILTQNLFSRRSGKKPDEIKDFPTSDRLQEP